jgi:monoamine oxidase
MDVLVLEARDRVGGRVWSDRVGGAVVERGGEFVLDGYTELTRLAAAHGLALADTGMSYYVREPRGVAVDTAALQAAGQRVADAAARAGSGRSVADLVAALGLDPAVADAVLARVEISSAHGAEQLDARALEHVAAFTPKPSHRIAGGNQQLALALAARLGDRVRLGTPVRALAGTTVQTDAGELDADHVIVAIPLPLARTLPGLPDWKRAALERVEVGHAAKLHVALERAPAASAVMSVPDRFWCWTAADGAGTIAPVVNCFAGSPRALEGLDAATWHGRLAALRPDLALSGEPLLTTWADDPWARGAYRADGLRALPGDDALLAAPAGDVHFAGEHTAGAWSGLMEGALRSGLRAAAEVAGGAA